MMHAVCASACVQVDELWLVNLHMHAPTVAESSDVHTLAQTYTYICIHLFMHTRPVTVRGVCDRSCNSRVKPAMLPGTSWQC